MLKVKESYYESKYKLVPIDEICQFIAFHPFAVEWLEAHSPKKVYFDLDFVSSVSAENESTTIETVSTLLITYFHSFNPTFVRQNLYWSKIVDSKDPNQFLSHPSYHLVCDLQAPTYVNRKLWILTIKKLNELLLLESITWIKFDDCCYNSGQNFRLINCSKPNESRFKVPVDNNIDVRNHLIGYSENWNECKVLQLNPVVNVPQFASRNEIVVVGVMDGFLKWLHEQFNNSNLKDFWANLATHYVSWVEILIAVIYSCLDHKNSKEDALEVYKEFSKFCSSKYTVQECHAKFEIEWGKREQIFTSKKSLNLQKKIVRQVLKYDSSILSPFENGIRHVPSAFFDTVEYNRSDDFVLFSIMQTPANSTQYLIVGFLNHELLNGFWRAQLSSTKDFLKLATILKYLPEEEKNDIEYYHECFIKMKEMSGYEIDPFGNDQELTITSIITHIAELLDVNIQSLLEKLEAQESDDSVKSAFFVFLKEIENFCIEQSITNVYNDIIQDYTNQKNLRKQPRPLLEITTDVRLIIMDIYNSLQNGICWKYQYPYKEQVKILVEECCYGDLDLIPFMLVKCSAKLFVAEPFYRLLCSAHSDHKAAEIVYHIYPFWMRTPQGIMVFDLNTGMWTRDEKTWLSIIVSLRNFLHIHSIEKGMKKNYGTCVELSEKVLKRCPHLLPPDYDMFESLKDSSSHKLLFGNGVYHGKTNEFTIAYGANNQYFDICSPCFTSFDIFFTGKINDPFLYEIDDLARDEMKEMEKVLFHDMHGIEIGNYHKECLALAIFGERHKGFYVHVGETNSGKSTEKALLEASFGTFIGTGLVDELSVIKDDKRDGAISNSMVWDNWDKRLLLFSEKNQRKIDTEKLKSYSSGQQDKIRARTQYQKSALFDIKFIMLFYLNHPLEVTDPTDPAFIDRARCFHWEKSFVDESKITDPTCQIPKRDDVCEWQYNQYKRQIFVLCILDSYKKYIERGHRLPTPSKVMYSTTSVIGKISTNDDLLESFLGHFIVDGNLANFVEKKEIDEICSANGIDSSKLIRRLPILMKDIGASKVPVVSVQKRAKNNKKMTVWRGLRKRTDEQSNFPILSQLTIWKSCMKHYDCEVPGNVLYKLSEIQKLKDGKVFLETDRQKITSYEVEFYDTLKLPIVGEKRKQDLVDFDEILQCLDS